MIKRILAGLAPAALLAALCGCGGSNAGSVHGKVTFDGQPVTGGTLVFYSETGSYSAGIRPDGTYSITDMPAGEMTVTVETESVNPKNQKTVVYDGRSQGGGGGNKMYPGGGGGGGGGKPGGAPVGPDGKKYSAGAGSPIPEGAPTEQGEYVKIPDKYADKAKSGIKKSVTGGKQQIDIELTQ